MLFIFFEKRNQERLLCLILIFNIKQGIKLEKCVLSKSYFKNSCMILTCIGHLGVEEKLKWGFQSTETNILLVRIQI